VCCREINGLRNDLEKRPRDKTEFYSKLSILKNICPNCSFKIEIESPLKKQTFLTLPVFDFILEPCYVRKNALP